MANLRLQKLQFAYWLPSFAQPEMDWQLKVGVLLVVIQLAIRAVKWILRNGQSLLRMRSARPAGAERLAVRTMALCSWQLFSTAVDVSKASFEAAGEQLVADVREAKDPKARALVLARDGLGMATLALPAFYAWTQDRAKVFIA